MNILHTLQPGKIGGTETHVLDLVHNLDETNFRSVVVSFTGGVFVERLKKMGITCYIVPTTKPFDPRIWKKLREIGQKEKIDVIHAHGTCAASNSIFMAKSMQLPLIYTIHSWAFTHSSNRLKFRVKKGIERFLISKSQRNIVISDTDLQLGVEKLKMRKAKLISYGVNTTHYHPNRDSKITKSSLCIPSDKTIVGFINAFSTLKDPFTLIKAFAAAIKVSPEIHLLMVGEGPLKQKCVQLINEKGISENVSLIPARTDVADILCHIDIFCYPSTSKISPIGILEAMAMKKSIITTPMGGITELIDTNLDGILCASGNVQDWASAIVQLHQNPKLRNELGERARQLVQSFHDIKRMTESIGAVYKSLLNKDSLHDEARPYIRA